MDCFFAFKVIWFLESSQGLFRVATIVPVLKRLDEYAPLLQENHVCHFSLPKTMFIQPSFYHVHCSRALVPLIWMHSCPASGIEY